MYTLTRNGAIHFKTAIILGEQQITQTNEID